MQVTFIKLTQELCFTLREIPLSHYSKITVVQTKQNLFLILSNNSYKGSNKGFLQDRQTHCSLYMQLQCDPAKLVCSVSKQRVHSSVSEEGHLPAMAWTATRRNPRTSPFSLTMATLWIRGTGYSRLLRYTNALEIETGRHS